MIGVLSTVFSALATTTLAQVTCTPFSKVGSSGCPYAAPTTGQLNALIDKYCGGTSCETNGGLPCYYSEELPQKSSDRKGYYYVATNTPYAGREGQATCYSALQGIVNACDEQYGEYGWVDGTQTVDGYPFEVVTCELI